MKISIPGHEVQGGGNRWWPMYTNSKGRLSYYKVNGKIVRMSSYEAALNYIYSRNPIGNEQQRARRGWTSISFKEGTQ